MFNQDFWLANAAIAPVITLACIVASSDTAILRHRSMPAPHGKRGKPRPRGYAISRRLYWLAGINVALQGAIIIFTLNSLAYHRNWAAPNLVTTVEGVGLFFLFMVSLGNAVVRRFSEEREAKDAQKSD